MFSQHGRVDVLYCRIVYPLIDSRMVLGLGPANRTRAILIPSAWAGPLLQRISLTHMYKVTVPSPLTSSHSIFSEMA
jgi:hypothetical protein